MVGGCCGIHAEVTLSTLSIKMIWLLSLSLDCWSAINGRSILLLKTRGEEGHGLDFGSLVKIRQQSEVGKTRSQL